MVVVRAATPHLIQSETGWITATTRRKPGVFDPADSHRSSHHPGGAPPKAEYAQRAYTASKRHPIPRISTYDREKHHFRPFDPWG
jgi:hypothetical protein